MYLNRLLAQDLKYYLLKNDRRELKAILNEMEPVDVAYAWGEFSIEDRSLLFSLLKPQSRASVLGKLEKEHQDEIVSELSSVELAGLLNMMAPDDRADLLGRQSRGRLKDIFAAMGPDAARDVKKLLLYAPDTAGGVMTTEYASAREEMTARQALLNLQGRMKQERYRHVNTVYVLDESGRVTGSCSLMNLIAAAPGKRMSEISEPLDNIKILAGTDIEEVAALFTHYDMLSAPVTDTDGRLQGVITIDDVMDIIQEEAEEDLALMAGVDAEDFHRPDLPSTLKTRLPWLIIAWIGGLAAGGVIGAFEHALEEVVALAAFIPVIMHMGGTIGVQSSTVIVRWLAIRKMEPGKLLRVFGHEFGTGVILSVIYAVLLGFISHMRYGTFTGMSRLWIVTGAGIGSVMILAAVAGALLPFGFRKIGADPAVATGPIITTILDVLGLGVYFTLAAAVLL